MKDQTLRRVYGFSISICIVVGLVALAALRNISQATNTADWVNHTHATIYELDRVISSVVMGDAAARNFIWTGDTRNLALAREELDESSYHLETAKALTREDDAVSAQVAALATLVEKHASAMISLTAVPPQKSQAEAVLKSDPGKDVLREIQHRAAKLRAGQFALLDQRDRAAYRKAQTTKWVVGIGVVLDLFLLTAVIWLVRDDIAARQRLAETLQEANAGLESKVRERTQALVATNRQLSAENRERLWSAQALEHQLRYLQTVANATSDLVFIITKSLTITRVNPAVSLRTGWAEEEILGHPLAELVREIDSPHDGPAAIVLALRSGRELHGLPAVLVDRRGIATSARLILLPLRDNDKSVGGVVLLQLMPT